MLHPSSRCPLFLAALLGLLPITAAPAAVLTKDHSARILPMGDSITEGKFYSHGGYRVLLQTMLKDNGYTFEYVGKEDNGQPGSDTGFSQGMSNPNHEGYGSFRIDEMRNGGSEEDHSAPAIKETLAHDKPDIILIMLGTNDVIQRHDLSGILGRLDDLVGAIFHDQKNVTIVLAAITPMTDSSRDAVAQTFNSGIPLIIAKYQAQGRHIVFADMHSALDPATDLSDGIHPTPSGFQKMAAVWYKALTGTEAASKP